MAMTAYDNLMSAKEKRITYRSLTSLAKSLEFMNVTVDLRNETSASGRIVFVDGFCNVFMEDVAFVEYEGHYKYFQQLYVPNRMVRDIIIPDNVKIADMLNNFSLAKKRIIPERKPGRTFKQKRAMMNQKETARMVADIIRVKSEK